MTTTTPDTFDCCSVPEPEQATDTVDACCTVPPVDSPDTAAIDAIKDADIPEGLAAARTAGFNLLLETAEPVDPDTWARAAGIQVDELLALLDGPTAAGRVELDESGRLLGIAGLTIRPTRHTITIGSTERWTWCALDAVGILGALGADGSIATTDPQTGAEITIPFIGGRPSDDAALFILGGYDGGSVRESWCPNVNFFEDVESAHAWVSGRDLEGDVVRITEVVDDASEMWRAVTGDSSRYAC